MFIGIAFVRSLFRSLVLLCIDVVRLCVGCRSF